MRSQKIADSFKNAIGTVFLLAGAFFVCSTFLSMRSVFADPVAPAFDPMMVGPQSGRGTAPARASGRTSPRSEGTVSRRAVARTAVATNPARTAAASRSVASRTVSGRGTVAAPSRANTVTTRANATATRNVVSRGGGNVATSRANATQTRTVRARTAATSAANNARISLQGSAIRGSKAAVSGTTSNYSYLSGKLYTGNYSNIIDSTTGLISNDAFNNCMESYYTCMDEICTARNAAQRRCACAGRVRAFAEAESALETANEELIQVSGELALLVASKGKDVSTAFQLTEAEKVMNCVSWKEAYKEGTWTTGSTDSEAYKWCTSHGIYEGAETCNMPTYCKNSGNDFGFDISGLDGSGSDILASLQAWADAKDKTVTILTDNKSGLFSAFENVSSVVGDLAGLSGNLDSTEETKDSLAETWGYELFEYAHNNVCARVLDSCFNGIYEACGTPPSGTKCSNGSATCPYNYNSKITVNNTGSYELNFVTASGNYSASNSATCFGYTANSGDPYSNLRGPVADARRSIMQKYALDANADCDVYGEQLRTAAQNVGYQKVAAQQALRQKRLEFAQEEEETVLAEAITAGTNFNECISEILDCYETQAKSNRDWADARIKTYCAQVANIPHCYEVMICNPSTAQFRAVIDVADSDSCLNSTDYTLNTCRNVVSLNDILKGTGAALAGDVAPNTTGSSIAMREQCLLNAGVSEIRTWQRTDSVNKRCSVAELFAQDQNATDGYIEDGTCIIKTCNPGYTLMNNSCIANSTDCTGEIDNASKAVREMVNGAWGACTVVSCNQNYSIVDNKCVANTMNCSATELSALNATSGKREWNGTSWSECVPSSCKDGYTKQGTSCVIDKCTTTGGNLVDGQCICKQGSTLSGGYCVINFDFWSTGTCTTTQNETACRTCAENAEKVVSRFACDGNGTMPNITDGVFKWNADEEKCEFIESICK